MRKAIHIHLLAPLVLALAAAVSAGCAIDADYSGTSFACAESGECPPGFSCQAGLCRAEDAPDAGRACDGAGAAEVLADGFSRGEELWQIEREGGAEVELGAGEATVTLPGQDVSAGAITSRCAFDLAGARVAVELVSVPDGARTLLEARPRGADARFAFEIDGGQLIMVFEEGANRQQASITFRAEDHRFLAISEQDGFFVFETSATGSSWGPEDSHDASALVGDLELRLAAEADAPGAVQTARFADLQGAELGR